MARPKRSVTQAIARLREVWKTDEALAGMPEVRAHVLSVAAHVETETGEMGILRQLAVVEVLQLYRRAVERELDALTQARVVAETIRALRSLGLLRPGRAGHGRPGAMWSKPGRRMVPPMRNNGQEQEAGPEPEQGGHEAEGETDDSAA